MSFDDENAFGGKIYDLQVVDPQKLTIRSVPGGQLRRGAE